MHIDGGKNSPRNREQVRSENQVTRRQLQFLKHLSHMPVTEDRIGGKVIGDRNKVSARIRLLTRTRHARLGIGNNPTLAIYHARLEQRRQSQDYRSRVAAWIRDQGCSWDAI